MTIQVKVSFLFCTFALIMCLNSISQESEIPLADNYTFETIDVPGVDFLALTASSDFEDYAGYTKSADGTKDVAFTLIDGVFETYEFPGAKNTYFYALGNNGIAAGHYEDSDGLYHGVILENGELRQYDFPNAIETFIYGYSDATEVLIGSYIDAEGVRRGFSGDSIIEYPNASATYADFGDPDGIVLGSYIDAEGVYRGYVRLPDGRFAAFDVPNSAELEYLFAHGYNDSGVGVLRAKAVDDVPRTYVGRYSDLREFQFPGAVSTEGWNMNQDGSVVGHYDTADGRRHGFIATTSAPVDEYPTPESDAFNYTFETIDVPGVDFLALTASSDFEDYAGNTPSADGERMIGFTLIDGVFSTHDFPGSQNTYFYALGNNGVAAGHYEDSEGLHHGIILENGELRQYDFPGAVETFIHGYSDSTGALTGSYIDSQGVRRGFSGETIIEHPDAVETFADFKNAEGSIVGSYIDSEGVHQAYLRFPDGNFVTLELPNATELEYFSYHGVSDARILVARAKAIDDVPRTYVGRFTLHELQFPDSVSTEGWNINQDGSVVGHYDTADGRRHGFIARPADQVDEEPVDIPADDNYTYETIDVPGVDFLALTASSDFEDYAGYTKSADGEKEIAFTLIDGVFNTYDFPGSQKTHFYALGNNGTAAGHFQDSDGLYHGVVLENGELRQYDFPGAVQTEIFGISDATGALTGNWTDATGVRRGFTGDTIIEYPEASATYSDFVNVSGGLVGSYIDAEGLYQPYIRAPNGGFVSINLQALGHSIFDDLTQLEYFFVHGVNDAGFIVARLKQRGDIPRTFIGTFIEFLSEFQFPGSVSTEGWNVNQDGSIVGHYDTADGRRHGFIAKPAADVDDESVIVPSLSQYTFENIDVPGVHFLAVTASNNLGDYAGYTKSVDGEKDVAFTLIDDVFETYDFPGSENTYFYSLGNNGNAAGYYADSAGLHHGVILDDGELRQYDFPEAVQTEIFEISDATGTLTGNFIDVSGVRRGFSGDNIIEVPGASATYANSINASVLVGSYIDAEGVFRAYGHPAKDIFLPVPLPNPSELEYFSVNDISEYFIGVAVAKRVGDVPRTYVGTLESGLHEFQFPGSVSTEGWNVNQDGSVVGHYDSPDGRRHGFIARPANKVRSDYFGNVYNVTLSKGLNMLSVPLAPPKPMTAKSLVAMTGATTIITLDSANQQFVGWTPSAPNDGFPIQGGKGYIVNVPQTRRFAFVGAPWTDQTKAAAPPAISQEREVWAFVVSGHLHGKPAFDGYNVIVRNLRTGSTITAAVQGNYFAAATANVSRRSVVEAGDVIEVGVLGPDGNVESHPLRSEVTAKHLADAVLAVRLDGVGQPERNRLLQNYPNPFNPETWIPYQLAQDSPVSISIYDTTGALIRTLSLGVQPAGFYHSRGSAAYWDGYNESGERVASGIYFYRLNTPSFHHTRQLVIVK